MIKYYFIYIFIIFSGCNSFKSNIGKYFYESHYKIVSRNIVDSLDANTAIIKGNFYDLISDTTYVGLVYVAEIKKGNWSDGNGNYEFSVPPGTWDITCENIRTILKIENIKLQPKEVIKIDFYIGGSVQ